MLLLLVTATAVNIVEPSGSMGGEGRAGVSRTKSNRSSIVETVAVFAVGVIDVSRGKCLCINQ